MTVCTGRLFLGASGATARGNYLASSSICMGGAFKVSYILRIWLLHYLQVGVHTFCSNLR